MSDDQKIIVLRAALEKIREATYAEFQLEVDYPKKPFNSKLHICPLCRRASTAEHLKSSWASIQPEAIRALRATENNVES